MSEIPCENCGNLYQNIARHWTSNPNCEHPSYSERQHAIIRGILLSQGSLEKDRGNPSLRVQSKHEGVLRWLDNEFGPLSRGVRKAKTAEEMKEDLKERGWDVSGEVSALYEWGLRAHPELERYSNAWYAEDADGNRERRVPTYVETRPETLCVWYLFSGRLARGDDDPHVIFPFTSMNAELETILNLLSPFNPRVYTDSKTEWAEKRQDIHLRDSASFFDYIGSPPSDELEEKWPQEGDSLMDDDDTGGTCPTCGRQYSYLSSHWGGGADCDFPELTSDQRDLLTALLLSGATLNKTGEDKRPHLLMDSTNLVFLDWVRDVLGVLCAHITERGGPEETINRLQEWLGVESEDADTVRRLQTRSHPFFEEATWADRFGNPERELHPPETLSQSPMVLKAIYLHRGSMPQYLDSTQPVIRTRRMPIDDDDLLDLFDGFEPRFTKLTSDHRVLIIGDGQSFFEYIGSPPLGMEYLWPDASPE